MTLVAAELIKKDMTSTHRDIAIAVAILVKRQIAITCQLRHNSDIFFLK
jgi:hypothetical protein